MFHYPRLPEALRYASEAHCNQPRKGTTTPYLSHLIGVSSLVLEHDGDEDQAIAGLLHDVLEDCGADHEAPIRLAFGDAVADIVVDCTDGAPDDQGQKPPWKDRKGAYLQHLQQVPMGSLLVSACDKLHNARAIATDQASGHDVFSRFKAGREGTLWYYRSLVEAFAQRLGPEQALVLELRHTVERMGDGFPVSSGVDG